MQRFIVSTGFLVVGLLAAFILAAIAEDKAKPSGTVDIEYREVRLLVGGSFGGGTLRFKGKSYPFTVGGLGIGGFGSSKVNAKGEVFDLEKVKDFPGTYLATRQGYAAGEEGKGSLWLKNSNGVVMRLKSKQEGLALSLGADGVGIKMGE